MNTAVIRRWQNDTACLNDWVGIEFQCFRMDICDLLSEILQIPGNTTMR